MSVSVPVGDAPIVPTRSVFRVIDKVGMDMRQMNAGARNWLHNQHFSLLAYVPAAIVGNFLGLVGFVTVMEIAKTGISTDLFEVPIMAIGMYVQLLDYLPMTLALSSIAMAPATFALLKSTRKWRPGNVMKYALLGMPVAALYVVGQMTFWLSEMGAALLEVPLGTVAAIILGGAAGGLTYLGVAAISGLSNLREDAVI